MRARISDLLGRRSVVNKSANELVKIINPILIGWKNYYGIVTAKPWLRKVDWYILKKFAIWYNKKTKGRNHLSYIKKVREILTTCKPSYLAE